MCEIKLFTIGWAIGMICGFLYGIFMGYDRWHKKDPAKEGDDG